MCRRLNTADVGHADCDVLSQMGEFIAHMASMLSKVLFNPLTIPFHCGWNEVVQVM